MLKWLAFVILLIGQSLWAAPYEIWSNGILIEETNPNEFKLSTEGLEEGYYTAYLFHIIRSNEKITGVNIVLESLVNVPMTINVSMETRKGEILSIKEDETAILLGDTNKLSLLTQDELPGLFSGQIIVPIEAQDIVSYGLTITMAANETRLFWLKDIDLIYEPIDLIHSYRFNIQGPTAVMIPEVGETQRQYEAQVYDGTGRLVTEEIEWFIEPTKGVGLSETGLLTLEPQAEAGELKLVLNLKDNVKWQETKSIQLENPLITAEDKTPLRMMPPQTQKTPWWLQTKYDAYVRIGCLLIGILFVIQYLIKRKE